MLYNAMLVQLPYQESAVSYLLFPNPVGYRHCKRLQVPWKYPSLNPPMHLGAATGITGKTPPSSSSKLESDSLPSFTLSSSSTDTNRLHLDKNECCQKFQHQGIRLRKVYRFRYFPHFAMM